MSPAKVAKIGHDVGHAAAPWAAIAAIALLIIQGQMNRPASAGSVQPEVLSVHLDRISEGMARLEKGQESLNNKLNPVINEITGLQIRVGALEQAKGGNP